MWLGFYSYVNLKWLLHCEDSFISHYIFDGPHNSETGHNEQKNKKNNVWIEVRLVHKVKNIAVRFKLGFPGTQKWVAELFWLGRSLMDSFFPCLLTRQDRKWAFFFILLNKCEPWDFSSWEPLAQAIQRIENWRTLCPHEDSDFNARACVRVCVCMCCIHAGQSC